MAKKRVNMMLEPDQVELLKELSRVTRVRMSEYIREGIEMIFVKYKKALGKAQKKGGEKG